MTESIIIVQLTVQVSKYYQKKVKIQGMYTKVNNRYR